MDYEDLQRSAVSKRLAGRCLKCEFISFNKDFIEVINVIREVWQHFLNTNDYL